MKELLRSVLYKEYQESLHDYLRGYGFTEEEAKAYEKFAEISMKKDIKVEQIYERAIPKVMKYFPGLCLELLKHVEEMDELEINYAHLYEKEFKVVPNKNGIVTIYINK